MRERGFSLAEVLVAVGVTSGILLSVAGLFVLGAREVKSGRLLTLATTSGNGIMEEISALPPRDVWGIVDGELADTEIVWTSDSAVPAYAGENVDNATDYTEMLNRWRDTVQEQVHPTAGYSLSVEGFENRPEGVDDGTTNFGAARFLRVELTVFWTEGKQRRRDVAFDLLKF